MFPQEENGSGNCMACEQVKILNTFRRLWIEHVLWGWLVFTIGLGVFFFTGFKNPAW
mgnify:CR=1 FL=1